MKKIRIGEREIGNEFPPYFVADIAANHDGELDRAFRLIELAKASGADAAKFQNFQASKIVSAKGFSSLGAQFSHQASWKKPVVEVYREASLPFAWTRRLKDKCNEVGIEYLTSPYDMESVDHVDPYLRAYKIGSGDITWLEIVEYIARKGKPVMIASGASDLLDVVRAIKILQKVTDDIVLMQCNTNYTASRNNFRHINLNVLRTFATMFPDTVLGLSDHTFGHSTVVAALALGARVFEKHFTDDNSREGPDHRFAMNPMTWREMVDRANEAYLALGDGTKRVEENEKETVVLQRRSLRYASNFQRGHVLKKQDIFPLRPSPHDAIPPYEIDQVVGRSLTRNVEAEDYLRRKDLA